MFSWLINSLISYDYPENQYDTALPETQRSIKDFSKFIYVAKISHMKWFPTSVIIAKRIKYKKYFNPPADRIQDRLSGLWHAKEATMISSRSSLHSR